MGLPHAAFNPDAVARSIDDATRQLVETVESLHEDDLRAPSLLPGWTRAHVLTHLARNADGGRRLLVWARTGVETPEYPSMQARTAEIEAGAARSATQLLADVRDSAKRFAEEYAKMPPDAWYSKVRWTGGHCGPAFEGARARLFEVLVHHVDLDARYSPEDWPNDFTTRALEDISAHVATLPTAPVVQMYAEDTRLSYCIGDDHASQKIIGTQAALLAWLLGRSAGDDLVAPANAPIPEMPAF
ncbi:maleylpyruvate isomerase family mycothiol-dependent enzyme [Actinopolymorpha pittospori]|uniref:Maleylpyruvate isomerase n=1 Tax=Actinopolymorpha pittospori TaxID=648752 RepID=A0A927RPF4_9ACTN|nr:maleylpyruvate isomerase family mycothiol-dependent enzyme [Actinopolymorpha pittospori]MBE1612076.1 maleylpyruvate isomerase [Actinopolymorpha pittospori]